MDPCSPGSAAASTAAGTADAPAPLPPHAALNAYYASESDHQQFLRRMFDGTAAHYERIEALLALGTGPWYRRQALLRAGLAEGARVLDVGIGTGLVARQALRLAGPRGQVVGVDPSPGMMSQIGLPGIELVQGRAEALPRPQASCDFLSMGYALRHISDVNAAFAEFHRVLRPGGHLLVLEITQPAGRTANALLKAYMRMMVPVLARVVTRSRDTAELWRYYWDTIEACIPPEKVLEALRRAGFNDVRRHVELGIFSEYTAVRPT